MMMDTDMHIDESYDHQAARELGLLPGDESKDYFLEMMRAAQETDQLKKQVKRHGMDYGLESIATKDEDTARELTENHYSRDGGR